MSAYQPHRPTDLFLVRLWRDEAKDTGDNGREGDSSSDGNTTEWQGKVQRVVDGESHQFRGWQGLVDLMLSMLSSNKGR